MVKKKINRATVILTSLLLSLILFFGIASASIVKVFAAENSNYDTEKILYLSDTQRITHDSSKSTSLENTRLWMAPSQIVNIPNNVVQAKIEGAWYNFDYGVYAHAPSYVVFDISEFSNKYKYFSAYAGLLQGASQSNGVLLRVQTSQDGQEWTTVPPSDTSVGTNSDGRQLVNYNQDFLHFSLDVTGVKWIKLDAGNNGNNTADWVIWADAQLSTTANAGGVASIASLDQQIKAKVGNVNWNTLGSDAKADLFKNNSELEKLILQREFISRAGQFALRKFTTQSGENNAANAAVLEWLLNDLDALREYMLGGTPFKGDYYKSLTVLSNLYKSYKKDLDDTTLLSGDGKPGSGNKFMPKRTFGELCRTMMFSVALTHDTTIGSYLQASVKANQSVANRRYAIFKYMYQTERFVATRNADGTWKSETMNMFGSLKVEEMRWLMCAIIDDESLIWLNDYVQTRINNAPNNVGNLYTPHSYVRYTDPNYNNPVFYDDANYDYFNALFSVDSREVKVGDKVIIEDDNKGTALAESQISGSAHNNANITHYGLWDSKYIVPAGEGEDDYEMSVSRTVTGVAKLQKVWMNFNNKFKTGSVCGGISKSGVNIRTSRGIPANVIGQPGHAAILYFSKDANGKGSWKIDNDVGGWLAATKGERHLLGWGNEAWQRNSGGTVVYFHLAQLCLDDYDNLVRAEEYCWLAKVYQGDLAKQEALYEKALTTQILNLDAWYGLVTTCKANTAKIAADYGTLARRIGDTLWNHPTAMHCLFRLFTDTEMTNVAAEVKATLNNPSFTTQLKTVETQALAKAKASGSSAAKSKVNYLLGLSDMSVASFDSGRIIWADSYKDGTFEWYYSVDGKNSWSDAIMFSSEDPDSQAYQLPDDDLAKVSAANGIYVYIKGASRDNAYKIDLAPPPALPDTLYANDWENRMIGVDTTYEWRYCKKVETETETGVEIAYKPLSNWISYAEASPDCTGEKAIEVRVKATGNKLPSESKVFTFTKDGDTPDKKYISINYLTMEGCSTQSQDAGRPNYAVNAIDGNANTYWHTDYSINIKLSTQGVKNASGKVETVSIPRQDPYLIIKLDAPTWLSAMEFSQRQYNSEFSIFAKKVEVFVSVDCVTWTKAGERRDLENIANLNVVNFGETDEKTGELLEPASYYGQYVKLVMTERYETNTNDGVFTTVSLINLYEDTTKKVTPSGDAMQSLSSTAPNKDVFADLNLGEIVDVQGAVDIAGEYVEPSAPGKSNVGAVVAIVIVVVVLLAGAGVTVFVLYKRGIIKIGGNNNADIVSEPKTKAKTPKATAKPKASTTAPKATTAAPKATTTTTAKPEAKPAATATAKPATKPAANATAKPATKPAATTAAKPATKPATKPAATATPKSTAKPTVIDAKPTAKPVTKPVTKPTTKK